MKILILICLLIPVSCMQGHLAQPIQEMQTIPFSFDSELIIIEAEVNDIKGRFLFDNGFSLSGLNEEFAERAGIKLNRTLSIRDANDKRAQLRAGNIQKLSIGQAEFINTGTYIVDTNLFLPCDPIDGVIGASVINKINWKIDFANHNLSLSSNHFEREGIKIDFNIAGNNSSLTKLNVNGASLHTKIDLGYQGSMGIRKQKYAEYFADEQAQQAIGITSLSATGLGNADTVYTFLNQVISHKEYELPIPAEINLSQNKKYDASIGVGYFKNYTVVIHSDEEHYYLDPINEKVHASPDSSFGISLYHIDGTLKVIQKDGNDPYLSKIPLFSEVTHLDKTGTEHFPTPCTLRSFLATKKGNKEPLELHIKGVETPVMLYRREPELISFKY